MADNKNIRDGRDRSKVDGNEAYELRVLAEKFGVSTKAVQDAITKVGNNRDDIERELNTGRNTN